MGIFRTSLFAIIVVTSITAAMQLQAPIAVHQPPVRVMSPEPIEYITLMVIENFSSDTVDILHYRDLSSSLLYSSSVTYSSRVPSIQLLQFAFIPPRTRIHLFWHISSTNNPTDTIEVGKIPVRILGYELKIIAGSEIVKITIHPDGTVQFFPA